MSILCGILLVAALIVLVDKLEEKGIIERPASPGYHQQ